MNFEDLQYNAFEDLNYSYENGAASFQQIFYISNILRSSSFDDEIKDDIEIGLNDLTHGEASLLIDKLKANQLDKFRDTNRFGLNELTKHLNEFL